MRGSREVPRCDAVSVAIYTGLFALDSWGEDERKWFAERERNRAPPIGIQAIHSISSGDVAVKAKGSR